MNVPELNLASIEKTFKTLPGQHDAPLPVKDNRLPDGVLKIPEKGSDKLNIKLSEDGVAVKFTERSRGRMKFQIKFSNDEAQSFRNYCTVFKSDEMHTDDFIKFLVFTGMRAYNDTVNNAVEKIQADSEAMAEIPETPETVAEDSEGESVPTTEA